MDDGTGQITKTSFKKWLYDGLPEQYKALFFPKKEVNRALIAGLGLGGLLLIMYLVNKNNKKNQLTT
jgi:hypothetical protein